MMRLKMSRPRLSVPRTCAPRSHSGAFSIASSVCCCGSYGARHGPRAPTTISPATIVPPTVTLSGRPRTRAPALAATTGRASVANPGIDGGIKSVDEKIDRDERDRVHEHDAGHERIVARRHARDEKAADAGPGEDSLDDDRAAEQRAELEADDRDDRNQIG